MIGIIAAVSINGVIGVDNKLPFHYTEDMKHFKKMTNDSVVIMGRKTFESLGKPLPNRENIVITSQDLKNTSVKCHGSVAQAMREENLKLRDRCVNIWFIGGASIYEEGMLYADEIYLTLIPEYVNQLNSVRFPFINPIIFEFNGYEQLSDKLTCAKYYRKTQNELYEKIISDTKVYKDKYRL